MAEVETERRSVVPWAIALVLLALAVILLLWRSEPVVESPAGAPGGALVVPAEAEAV